MREIMSDVLSIRITKIVKYYCKKEKVKKTSSEHCSREIQGRFQGKDSDTRESQ
jgi:hypothetical protein